MMSFLDYWLLLPQVWLIIGMVLALMELIEGSQIFFLPVGLGGICNSLLLYLEREGIIPFGYAPETWYGTLIPWAVCSVAFAFLLSVRRRRKKQSADINDY